MTPSPSPTSSSSPSSHPSSTPTPRPPTPPFPQSFTPPTLPPISQLPFHPDYIPPSLDMGASAPSDPTSTPKIPSPSRKRSRHGKHKAEGSDSAQISGAFTSTQGSAAGPSTSRSSLGEPDHHQPRQQAKKKRTRTLTTPQQSAVLHALLAQSRFPTTAMREEVGRSIGLSARKVQVWFQNQRQKSRKPRTEGGGGGSGGGDDTMSVSMSSAQARPPQFGPFTAGPSTLATTVADVSLGILASPGPSRSGGGSVYAAFHGSRDPLTGITPYISPQRSGQHEFREHATRSPTGEAYSGRSGSGSGPPSRSSDSSGSFSSPPHLHLPPPVPPSYLSAHRMHSPPYSSRALYQHQPPPEGYTRHFLSGPGPSTMRPASPVVLPPLRFDQGHGQQHDQGQGQSPSREGPFRQPGVWTLPPPPLHHGLPLPALPPRAASFPSLSPAEHDPEAAREHSSPPRSRPRVRPRRGDSLTLSAGAFPLPPPFTLQPQPQWDPPVLLPGAGPLPILPPPHSHPHPHSIVTALSMPPQGLPSSQGSHGPARHRTASDPMRTVPPPPPSLITELWSAARPRRRGQSPVQRGGGAGAGTMPFSRRFDPVHEVAGGGGDGEGEGERDGEGEGDGGMYAPVRGDISSRGMYDFARRGGGAHSPAEDEMSDVRPEAEEARHEPEGGEGRSPDMDDDTEHRG